MASQVIEFPVVNTATQEGLRYGSQRIEVGVQYSTSIAMDQFLNLEYMELEITAKSSHKTLAITMLEFDKEIANLAKRFMKSPKQLEGRCRKELGDLNAGS